MMWKLRGIMAHDPPTHTPYAVVLELHAKCIMWGRNAILRKSSRAVSIE